MCGLLFKYVLLSTDTSDNSHIHFEMQQTKSGTKLVKYNLQRRHIKVTQKLQLLAIQITLNCALCSGREKISNIM